MKLKDINEIFSDDLRDPAYAIGYLTVSFEEDGIDGFKYALQKVMGAYDDISIHEVSNPV